MNTFFKNITYFLVVFVTLFQLHTVFGSSNSYKIQHLELPESVGVVSAHCFAEDANGFLYVGLEVGLYRYDGHEVNEIFYLDEIGNKTSFRQVVSLQVDKDGELWIGSRQSIFIYNPETDKSRRFIIDESIGVEYRDLFITRNSEIVIGTNKGLRIYNKDSREFELYIHSTDDKKSISHNVVRDIYEDTDGNLWIGTYNGLNKFNRHLKSFTSFDLKPNGIDVEKNNLILNIQPYPDESKNQLLVGTETGLVLFNTNDDSFKVFTTENTNGEISNDVVKTICPISTGQIWFGTDFGLNRYSFQNGEPTSFYHEFGNDNSISHDVINALFKDTQGNLWIGTDNGIDKIYIPSESILFNQTHMNSVQFDGSIEVNSLLEDTKGNLWIASNQGLVKYNREKDSYQEFHPPEILHTKVSNLFIDSSDNVWFATPGGVNRYLVDQNRFESYTAREGEEGYLTTNYTSDIVVDSFGNIWVSTLNKGLFLLKNDDEDNGFVNINIGVNRIKELELDTNNNLWINSYSSLIRLNTATLDFQVESNKDDFPSGSIFDIYIDEVIWVASSNGIFKWNNTNNSFNLITNFGQSINGLVVDENKVWFTSVSNIYQFDLAEEKLKKVPSYETRNVKFNKKGFKDSSNQIYFSSFDGFISFVPNEVEFSTITPYIRFTDFKVLGKSKTVDIEFYNDLLSNRAVNELKEIVLGYNDNSFNISVSSLNLIDNKSVSYSYILEGYDDDWKELTNGDNTANYEKIAPGKYIFKVKTSNAYGVKSENSREFAITVNSPFYASDLAWVIYFLLIVASLVIINKILISREQYNNKIELEKFQRLKSEELVELKAKFFSTITHELKTPITLIKTPIEKMITEESDKSKLKNLDLINRNANRLIKLVNQVLDIRKFEKGLEVLEIQEYDIVRFCKTLFVQFEQEAQKRNINLKFESNVDSLNLWFDLDKIEKVIINLLSNANKFTQDEGEITLKIKYKKESSHVVISIKDTGVGIKEEDKKYVFDRFSTIHSKNFTNQGGSGIGLSLVKEFITLHNGSVQVKSKVNKGSTFIIHLPIEKESLNNYVIKNTTPNIESQVNSIQETITNEENVKEKLPLLLLVEDEVDMRDFVSDSLKNHFKILLAENGVEGLKKATKRIPDIIISDVMMPIMDGFELCKKLKSDVRTSHIPIILLSARSDANNKLAGVEYGADDYVGKPFKLDYLITKAQKLIDQRNTLKSSFLKQQSIEPSKITITSLDENFLKKVITQIEKNIDNADLNVKMLSELMNMNHVNFYRKIKGLTGQTATDFIRTVRLKRAAQLLKSNQYNVKEAMYMVGFTHRSYFSKMFKEQFGVNPKDYS